MLAVRTVQLDEAEQYGMGGQFKRDLGHDDRRTAAVHVDLGRRRGPADLPRTGALRRGRGRRDQSCVTLHRTDYAGGLHRAGLALGVVGDGPECSADGYAITAEGELRHLFVFAGEPGDSYGAAALRHDPGRQWERDLYQWRARQPVEQQ